MLKMPSERIELPASGLQDQRSATELWSIYKTATRVQDVIIATCMNYMTWRIPSSSTGVAGVQIKNVILFKY